jgi:hypothetical protein
LLPDDVPPDGLEGALPEGAPEGLVGFFWFVVLPGLPAVEPEDAELPPVAP